MSSSTTAFAMTAPRARAASNPVVSTAGGQTVVDTAPTRTATNGLSTYTGLSFQALEVGGEVVPNFARGATHLQVLPGQVNTFFTSSTFTFTTTRSVVETDNGQPTTFPLTIASTGISLVPVVTTTSQSLPLPRLTNPYKAIIIAGAVFDGVLLLIVIFCLFLLRNGRRRRAFDSNPRPQSPLADAEQSVSTIVPQPPAAPSAFLSLCFCRRRAAKGTEISVAQCPRSLKETTNPFDDSNAIRESWEPYIDRRQTQQNILSYNTVSTRRLYISNQVNRAREKVAELERMSTLLRSLTLSSRGSGSGITATAVGGDGDDAELRGVQEKLERAIQQIEGLNNRIQELEMQQRALSAEPPDHPEI